MRPGETNSFGMAAERLGFQYESLENIRNQIANAVLWAIVIFGAPTAAAAISRASQLGGLGVVAIHAGIYLVCVATAVFHRYLSLNLRAWVILGSAFLIASSGIFKWGLIGQGVPFFMMCSVVTTIFFGARPGILATGAGLVVLAVVGSCLHAGLLRLDFDIQEFAVATSTWITAGVVYGFFTAILVNSLGRLYDSMNTSIETLSHRSLELQRVNRHLENEIAERKRAEEALRESEEKYRTILEAIEEGYYEVDIKGTHTFFNESLCRMFGYTRDELMGMTYRQLNDEESSLKRFWR